MKCWGAIEAPWVSTRRLKSSLRASQGLVVASVPTVIKVTKQDDAFVTVVCNPTKPPKQTTSLAAAKDWTYSTIS